MDSSFAGRAWLAFVGTFVPIISGADIRNLNDSDADSFPNADRSSVRLADRISGLFWGAEA